MLNIWYQSFADRHNLNDLIGSRRARYSVEDLIWIPFKNYGSIIRAWLSNALADAHEDEPSAFRKMPTLYTYSWLSLSCSEKNRAIHATVQTQSSKQSHFLHYAPVKMPAHQRHLLPVQKKTVIPSHHFMGWPFSLKCFLQKDGWITTTNWEPKDLEQVCPWIKNALAHSSHPGPWSQI